MHILQGLQTIQLEVGSFGCFSDTSLQLFVNGPIAEFRYKQYCDSPYVVDFIDKSQIATRWLYNFGDNTTSTLRNPRHRITLQMGYIQLRKLPITTRIPVCLIHLFKP
jgi:hypothetical protein